MKFLCRIFKHYPLLEKISGEVGTYTCTRCGITGTAFHSNEWGGLRRETGIMWG